MGKLDTQGITPLLNSLSGIKLVLPRYKMVTVPGVARCGDCKRVFDLEVLREVEGYVAGECPRCGGGLRAKKERKYERTWLC